MNRILLPCIFILSSNLSFGQSNGFSIYLDSGKATFKRQTAAQTPDYSGAFRWLTKAVNANPVNAEAKYFLGYTIDRMNANDASRMPDIKLDLALKASRQFEQLNKLQPVYQGEMISLDPYSKIGSIWGCLAQAYLIRHLTDSANWAFREGKKRGGFIEPILEYNRQLLNSCSKNAILVTSGDNITIPAWYLQTIENFRTDIQVVDVNLINTDWYPKYLKNNKNVLMGFSDVELDTINYIPWTATPETIRNPKDSSKTFNWTLQPTYNNEYILRGDRILLDILQQNLYNRDFYFTDGTDTTNNLFLTAHLVDDGILSRLILQQNDPSTTHTILSENLRFYNINTLDSKEIQKSKDAVFALNSFRLAFYNNSAFLYSKGELAEARRLIAEMEQRFDVKKLPYISKEFFTQLQRLKKLLQ
jgi:hypothetical protein